MCGCSCISIRFSVEKRCEYDAHALLCAGPLVLFSSPRPVLALNFDERWLMIPLGLTGGAGRRRSLVLPEPPMLGALILVVEAQPSEP